MKFCFLVILTLICSNPIQHGYQLCPCLTYTNVYNPRQEWYQCIQSPTRVTPVYTIPDKSDTSVYNPRQEWLRQLQLLLIIYICEQSWQTNTHTCTNNQHERSLSGLLYTFLSDSKGKGWETHHCNKHFDAGTFLCDLSNTSFDAIYGLSDPDEALAHFYQYCSY